MRRAGGSGSGIVRWHLGVVFALVPTQLECSTKKRERAKKTEKLFQAWCELSKGNSTVYGDNMRLQCLLSFNSGFVKVTPVVHVLSSCPN